MPSAAGDSAAVRAQLIEALEAELVGPFRNPTGASFSDAVEDLRIAPSRWYLTGFLVPREQGEIEEPDDEDDELGAGDDTDEEDGAPADPTAKRVRRLPASMGLSVFTTPSVKSLIAHVSWADYERIELDTKTLFWRRSAQHRTVEIPLDDRILREGLLVPESRGLRLEGHLERMKDGNLAIAIFLINARPPVDVGSLRDTSYAFQTHLALESPGGFIGRPDTTGEASDDFDDQVNDLHFRERREWAVGHGVSARVNGDQAPVTRVESDWMPRVKVLPVEARKLESVLVTL